MKLGNLTVSLSCLLAAGQAQILLVQPTADQTAADVEDLEGEVATALAAFSSGIQLEAQKARATNVASHEGHTGRNLGKTGTAGERNEDDKETEQTGKNEAEEQDEDDEENEQKENPHAREQEDHKHLTAAPGDASAENQSAEADQDVRTVGVIIKELAPVIGGDSQKQRRQFLLVAKKPRHRQQLVPRVEQDPAMRQMRSFADDMLSSIVFGRDDADLHGPTDIATGRGSATIEQTVENPQRFKATDSLEQKELDDTDAQAVDGNAADQAAMSDPAMDRMRSIADDAANLEPGNTEDAGKDGGKLEQSSRDNGQAAFETATRDPDVMSSEAVEEKQKLQHLRRERSALRVENKQLRGLRLVLRHELNVKKDISKLETKNKELRNENAHLQADVQEKLGDV